MSKKSKLAEEMVDLILDENFETFGKVVKAFKKLDRILDSCNADEAVGGFAMDSVEDEVEENDIPHDPTNVDDLMSSLRKQLAEIRSLSENDKEEYKKFFDSMLKKFGVSSPAELDNDKKKEFFDAVNRGWQTPEEKK